MRPSLSATRVLDLSPSLDAPEDRAHFQRRLAVLFLLVGTLSALFYVMNLVTGVFFAPGDLVYVLWKATETKLHVGGTVIALLIGAFAHAKGERSVRALLVADAVGTIVTCSVFAAMAFAMPRSLRGELTSILASICLLSARASLVPSPVGRTALLSALAVTPTVAMTPKMYEGVAIVIQPGHVMDATRVTIFTATWAIAAVLCSMCISWVVYGLQREVRAARQLGQYVLEDKLGEGGMGEVYRARHALLRRPTAIKLLTGTTQESAQRFEREVRLTARLTHPNTVAIYDFGRTPDGVFYYAMELLDGVDLEHLVSEHGPQSASRVVHLLLQVCGALDEAHAEGLVHRDIKPSNIILTERGRIPDVAKVVDFGLVKDASGGSPQLSNVDAILGTPFYMAPEAIVSPETIDGRADLYALGATAYFLLTGEHVFSGSTLVEVCSHHLHSKPTPLRERRADVPEALEAVIMTCLEKKPSDRPATAAALRERLAACPVEPWTTEEARAWWETHATARASGTRRTADAFGKTIAVAMDGRAS